MVFIVKSDMFWLYGFIWLCGFMALWPGFVALWLCSLALFKLLLVTPEACQSRNFTNIFKTAFTALFFSIIFFCTNWDFSFCSHNSIAMGVGNILRFGISKLIKFFALLSSTRDRWLMILWHCQLIYFFFFFTA